MADEIGESGKGDSRADDHLDAFDGKEGTWYLVNDDEKKCLPIGFSKT
jgi:hypothetical protein